MDYHTGLLDSSQGPLADQGPQIPNDEINTLLPQTEAKIVVKAVD